MTAESLSSAPRGTSGPPVVLALRAADAAAAVGLSLRGFRRGVSAGRIPAGVKVGARRVWPVENLQRWLEAGAPAADEGARGAEP